MSTIFPGSASVGQIFEGYLFNGTAWDLIGNEFNPTTFSPDAPDNPKAGDLWVDSDSDVPSISPETILTIDSASAIYLDKNSASTAYLTKTSASNTYATKAELENIDALPLQTDNAGKYLTTSGSAAFWSTIDLTGAINTASAAAVSAIVDSAPATLDTLNELAAALGDDENFASTVATSLGEKAPIESPTFTGTVVIPTLDLTNPLSPQDGGTGLNSLGSAGYVLKVNSGANALEWGSIAGAVYQDSAPTSPQTGDIWIDSDDDVPSVDSTLYYRWTKTMSGGETSLSGTDDNSLALKYTPGYESVFINGVLQVRGQDYVATTGTTVTGLTALTASDVVMVESIIAYSVGDTYTQSQIGSLLDAKSPVSTTGLVLIASQTIGSAVSSVVVNNAFSATYDAYKIVISGGVASTVVNLGLKLGASAASYSYITTGVNSLGSAATSRVTSGASFPLAGSGNADTLNLNLDIVNPFLAKYSLVNTSFADDNTTGYVMLGTHKVATSYTDFTLTPSSGTLTGGTIKVYGYK